jgi:hypothetical protein
MIYEISNPSDCVTIESDDESAAAISVLLIGQGGCGLTREDGESALPIMLFGGEEHLKALLAEHGIGEGLEYADLDEYIRANRLAMASALNSAIYCSMSDRKGIAAAVKAVGGDYQKAMAAFNDEKRTSLNNIGEACFAYGEKLLRMEDEHAAG